MVGPFGEAISQSIPKLEYLETESGIRQIATRSATNVRISDWTFPIAIISSRRRSRDEPWVHRGVWNVPMDDTHTLKYGVFANSEAEPEADREMLDYCNRISITNPQSTTRRCSSAGKFPTEPLIELTPAQDYFAIMGRV